MTPAKISALVNNSGVMVAVQKTDEPTLIGILKTRKILSYDWIPMYLGRVWESCLPNELSKETLGMLVEKSSLFSYVAAKAVATKGGVLTPPQREVLLGGINTSLGACIAAQSGLLTPEQQRRVIALVDEECHAEVLLRCVALTGEELGRLVGLIKSPTNAYVILKSGKPLPDSLVVGLSRLITERRAVFELLRHTQYQILSVAYADIIESASEWDSACLIRWCSVLSPTQWDNAFRSISDPVCAGHALGSKNLSSAERAWLVELVTTSNAAYTALLDQDVALSDLEREKLQAVV